VQENPPLSRRLTVPTILHFLIGVAVLALHEFLRR
jgi:hypothetical protein